MGHLTQRGIYAFLCLAVAVSFVPNTLTFAAKPNDPSYQRIKSWGNIALEQAWDITQGSNQVIVAVLDSGVDMDHADLQDNLWENTKEIPGDGKDNDNNGYVDDVRGWDFIDEDNNPAPDLANYTEIGLNHGTVVAGIVGALGNNGIDGAGVNWRVKIMPLRILDNLGAGDTTMATRAIDYAIAHDVDVINLSLVGTTHVPSFKNAIERAYDAGIIVVAAAGNAALSEGELPTNLSVIPRFPVCYEGSLENKNIVVGVAAVDENDVIADFSHYGGDCIDISAPGEFLPSTSYHDPIEDFTSSYGTQWSGTSVAVPLVSGAAALIRAVNPDLSTQEVVDILKNGADGLKDTNPVKSVYLGSGRLNIRNSLNLALDTVPVVEEPTDEVEKLDPEVFRIVTVPESASVATVKVFSSGGSLISQFDAFESDFTGGATVTAGDTDGDGVPEIIVGKGVGGEPMVRIFSQDGTLQHEFLVDRSVDRRGIRVGVMDFDTDGKVEIVSVPLSGESEFIKVHRANGRQLIRFSPGEREYPFGIHMASGFVNGKPRIVISERNGADQRIEAWDGIGAFINEWSLSSVRSQRPTMGLGDMNLDGIADIVLGASPGNEPYIYTRPFDFSQTRSEFLAYNKGFRGGVHVAVPKGRIVTAPGKGAKSVIRVFTAAGDIQTEFMAYSKFYRGGVNIATFETQ